MHTTCRHHLGYVQQPYTHDWGTMSAPAKAQPRRSYAHPYASLGMNASTLQLSVGHMSVGTTPAARPAALCWAYVGTTDAALQLSTSQGVPHYKASASQV
eukprot:355233-Chlamydomonas_euryale.AAC.4